MVSNVQSKGILLSITLVEGGRVGYFGFSWPIECIWSSHYIADSSQEKLMCSCMGGVHSTVFYNKFNSTKIFMQC